MPEPSHPPYLSSAQNQPRTLNRWLDVNAQNGALTRVGTFIKLPTFSQAGTTWNGYSDIVFAFNFESPNNFSLRLFTPPTAPNYALCVSFRVGTKITRYVMWDAVGSKLDQELDVYHGQLISKNFRFEVWNTSQGVASETVGATFTTSVLGSVDYRYGSDGVLVGADPVVSDFKDVSTYIPLPVPSTNILTANYLVAPQYFDSAQGKWYANDMYHNFMSPGQNYTVAVDPTIGGLYSVTIPANQSWMGGISNQVATTAYGVFILAKFSAFNTGDVIFGFGGDGFTQTPADLPVTMDGLGGVVFNGQTLPANLAGSGSYMQLNKWYVIFLWYNVVGGTTDPGTGYIVDGHTGGYITDLALAADQMFSETVFTTPQPNMQNVDVGDAPGSAITAPMNIASILIYQPTTNNPLNQTARQGILNYLTSVYVSGQYSIPLTFPSNSVSVSN